MSLVIRIFFGIVAAAVIAIIAYVVIDQARFIKTLYLIARVSPYEQPGTGAGAILVIGDSTGYGTGATRSELSVAGRLGAEYPTFSIENRSVNGDTIKDALMRVEAMEVAQYDMILLQLGANDILGGRPLDESVADLIALITKLESHSPAIVLMTAGNVGAVPAFSGEKAAAYTAAALAYHERVEAIAAARSYLTYVNLYQPPSEDPFIAQSDRYVAWDALHPSDAGYGLWYKSLQPVVASQLSR